jgi:hypothetical protein
MTLLRLFAKVRLASAAMIAVVPRIGGRLRLLEHKLAPARLHEASAPIVSVRV